MGMGVIYYISIYTEIKTQFQVYARNQEVTAKNRNSRQKGNLLVRVYQVTPVCSVTEIHWVVFRGKHQVILNSSLSYSMEETNQQRNKRSSQRDSHSSKREYTEAT